MREDELLTVLNYIDMHICEKIILSELAELVGYSPFYFSKLFSESMGISVSGYVRVRKLQYAFRALSEGMRVVDVDQPNLFMCSNMISCDTITFMLN